MGTHAHQEKEKVMRPASAGPKLKIRTDEIIVEPKAKKTQISPPNFQVAEFLITGTSDYVANKFSQEARDAMRAKQEAGAQSKKGKAREPKDFDKAYRGAMHCFEDGSAGIPASCFRQALISACRIVGFKMTLAKLAVFVEADGLDVDDGSPLVKITKGKPRRVDSCVRNETGVADIRPRPHWAPGWQANVRIRYDADLFEAGDVENLLLRVGIQVGIGAGRPDSKESAGQGWGTFSVERLETSSESHASS
jgi:hypothetical protein